MQKIIIILSIITFLYSSNIPTKECQIKNQNSNPIEFHRDLLPEQNDYDVLSYVLDIQIDPETQQVDGSVIIDVSIKNETHEIILDAKDHLDIENVSVFVDDNQISVLSENHFNNRINLLFESNFLENDTLSITIEYSGATGSGVAWEGGIVYSSGGFYSLNCPYGLSDWVPCKDHPSDKANYVDLKLTVPDDLIVASNGVLQEIINNYDDTKTHHWLENYPIATYLFVVNVYPYLETIEYFHYAENDSMPIIYYTTGTVPSGFHDVETALPIFSDLYGLYPFVDEKFAIAKVTNSSWAMEHQTCVTTATTSGIVQVHELAHQWFGDKVTCRDWQHGWLNEGFATYSEALYVENTSGVNSYHNYMNSMEFGWGDSRSVFTIDTIGVWDIFDGIIYNKGAWVNHMLRKVVGDEIYFASLQDYLEIYAYQNAVTEDLQSVFESHYGSDLNWFFQEWIYGIGSPDYDYATYSSELTDSIKITLVSYGSETTSFNMPIPFEMSGVEYSVWSEDGVNIYTYFSEIEFPNIDWDPNNWVLDHGFSEQIPEIEEANSNRDGSVMLMWEEYFDPTIEGFNVYRKYDSEGWTQINTEPITENDYNDTNVISGTEYQYKIVAILDTNLEYFSKFSNEISMIPVEFTFDNGILIVDKTKDNSQSNPFPTDEEVDDFYDLLLSNYLTTNWDADDQGLPELFEMAKYSSIVWHNDDINNNPLDSDTYNLKQYIDAGGNLLLSSWKQLSNEDEAFLQDYLHIANIEFNTSEDFFGVFGDTGFANMEVDSSKAPSQWDYKLRNVNKFVPLNGAEPIYRFDSDSDDSEWENEVCGIRSIGENKVFVLGFPLYFMETSSAQEFVEVVMDDFGEEQLENNSQLSFVNYQLLNAYPNPFNPKTVIGYSVPMVETNGRVSLQMFDINGRLIETLLNGIKEAGYHEVTWNASNYPSGIYFVKLQSENFTQTQKLLLLK
ncbi:MAG: T9SS type A sorting domain-containing protein [Candidatus Marinimicrobia bacterium]|nr:T9SS type A sorting domain-containing protein [Candidatus Neomarinimicrobiota bacterium]MBL7022566.1 T9SS type A sorting domain-containing protein [Candidatus Neomarinimicrobiota bacterium]MBL7108922.1 T9SS type A sorting domain-containing protein [Candidatus Neomarinimicrobiota bacterium]